MKRFAHLPIAAGLALAFTGAEAGNSTLQIDGRFYVQGASLRTARVILSRDDQAPQVFTEDIRQLKIELDLQEVYTLTFEREGCRSKAILFDTRMSEADMAFAPFVFLFDVTLELVTPGADQPYAGPVGYVRYEPDNKDFGYDRLYRLTHDEKGELLAGVELDQPGQNTIPMEPVREERRWVQPFIDPTMAMEREAAARSTLTAEGIAVIGAPMPARYAEEDMARSLIVEQDRGVTIVRVKDGAGRADYRRIMHSNGTVLHYRNGSNCSYLEYIAAVGQR